MYKHNILFIGLDTHKVSTEVAHVEDQRGAKPVHFGKINTTKAAITKLARQYQSKYPHATLHFVYEAGPCGYWIYRLLTSLGHCCYVVAPSLIPKKPGERVKTDKRDALKLAKLLKDEELTPIYVPESEDEAIRDLSRARETAMADLKDAKYQLKALQAVRGVRLLIATGIIAELGDLRRFDHPRKLMSYLGLVSKEHSSGDKRRLGSITKCGNGRARRLLVQGAHTYKHKANISTELQKRQEGLPKEITDIAWQAQLRLCRRYNRLMSRGKHRNVVVIAIAREMAAYIWAIAREVVISPVNPRLRISRVPA